MTVWYLHRIARDTDEQFYQLNDTVNNIWLYDDSDVWTDHNYTLCADKDAVHIDLITNDTWMTPLTTASASQLFSARVVKCTLGLLLS